MKLYLSSYRIPNIYALLELIGKTAPEIKVALIPNAKDYYAGLARAFKRSQSTSYFQDLGMTSEIVDLVDYSDSKDLKTALEKFDLIWAIGGNTFILRYEMYRSGFDSAIKELLREGKVYGGESAGAIVAGNDLHGIEFADEAEFAEEIKWDGMNLTDHFVLPHVDNVEYSGAIEKTREIHRDDKSVIELLDSQAFIVNGDSSRII